MEIISIHQEDLNIAEIRSDQFVIQNVEDGINILGEVYYGGYDAVILHQKNICPLFFDLSTKLAGEILQKFTNYRVRLAIVGDFSQITNQNLLDFIRESNKGRQVLFLESTEIAVEKLRQL